MTDHELQRLLLDCGFVQLAAPRSARWMVAGRIEGAPLHVTCAIGARGGCVLLVASESERRALLTLLSRHGAGAADVRAERMEPQSLPWLTVGVGVGALALFSWVLTSINAF